MRRIIESPFENSFRRYGTTSVLGGIVLEQSLRSPELRLFREAGAEHR